MPTIFFVLLGVGFVWLIIKLNETRDELSALRALLHRLEGELLKLKPQVAPEPPPSAQAPATEPAADTVAALPHSRVQPQKTEKPGVALSPPPLLPEPVQPPPFPPTASFQPAQKSPPALSGFETAPPVLASAPPANETGPSQPARSGINWEQFMGVKLTAWLGGLALFLGIAFFVKYSFDNNLVPPELRVAIGFASGLGLLVGGMLLSRRGYQALSQTLCATGVVVLYAVTFACRSIYHFQFFGAIPTFFLMTLITATAFLLAVQLNALVVAVLGMLGGFLTPILLSTGQDNPLGLFGYIAILDAGLLLVALNRGWFFLTALAAFGTALMQIGWSAKFFSVERYFEGNKVFIALAVFFGFNVQYLAANWWAKRRDQMNWWLIGASFGLTAVALAFVPYFLSFPPLAARPWVIFGFVFAIDLLLLLLVLVEKKIAFAQPLAGLAVFLLLALWTGQSLTTELLNTALVLYLGFAALHSAVPLLLQRRGLPVSTPWNQLFPPLALVLVLIPITRLVELPFSVWPFVLLVDLLAIGLAVLTASLLPVMAVLLLTLGATSALIFKIPADLTGTNEFLILLAVFTVVFVAVGVWLARKFKGTSALGKLATEAGFDAPANLAAMLPLFSAALPFLLLIMATQRLQLANPSPVFGLGLLLTFLLFGLAIVLSADWLPAVALVCVAALEAAWHFRHFDAAGAATPLVWYVIFYVAFTLFPFMFLKRFAEKKVPWAAAAMVGPPQFFLIYRLVKASWPNQMMGLLPASFALPALLGLVILLKKIPSSNQARLTQLAWFGGVALFFITLIFPIQLDRQWITIGWALEGTALLWLFHRVPHPGLRVTGIALLVAAFARLALNPAVLEYHARSATPILNWYLYAYGIATLCLFGGARLIAPPRHRVFSVNAQALLATLGTVLAFLLLNIEIADYFSTEGSTLTFKFSGNFARDMTYSIAWALSALLLLVVGIVRRIPASRYAALGLLSVTLLKLFFHDLAQLGPLYRIGAFIGVAVIAMLASFAYQRFYISNAKEKEAKDAAAE